MDEIISYEELRKMQTLERENKALQEIEPAFFNKVKEYISTKEKLLEENKIKDNLFSRQAVEKNEQELKNVRKILDDICSRRRKKIVLQALTNLTAKVHNTEHMLPEEEELYNNTIDIVNKYNCAFSFKFEKNHTPAEDLKPSPTRFKLMEEIPAFAWKDNVVYGPFKREDVAELPEEIGEILIKEGKAIQFTEM